MLTAGIEQEAGCNVANRCRASSVSVCTEPGNSDARNMWNDKAILLDHMRIIIVVTTVGVSMHKNNCCQADSKPSPSVETSAECRRFQQRVRDRNRLKVWRAQARSRGHVLNVKQGHVKKQWKLSRLGRVVFGRCQNQ